MTTPVTGRDCPNDGAAMVRTLGSVLTPPWLCTTCSRLWWNSQLTEAARALWVPALQGYAPGAAGTTLRQKARAERDAAVDKVKGNA